MSGNPAALDRTFAWAQPIAEFAIHAFVGTIIFSIVAVPAVGLDYLQRYLEIHDEVIRFGVRFAEYALLFTDVALFVTFLIRTAWRTARKF